MKILYVSSVMSKEFFDKLMPKLKVKTYYSIQKFHNLIIDGLNNDNNIKITALCGIPISRNNTKKTFWGKKYIKENGIEYIHCPFINIKGLKQIFISISMFIETLKWIIRTKKEKRIIICDSSYISVTPQVNFLAKKFKIKVIGIVADIYKYMLPNKNILAKYSWDSYSGYVFLTEPMNSLINTRNVPYIVMEGLVDIQTEKVVNLLKDKYKEKVCVYAGGLNEKYGIKSLIEGFINIENKDAKLYLYGIGDMVDYINQLDNDKVKYFGNVANEEVLEAERKATLLLNPRFSNQDYTKYSFPSKIMEYMASGTPVLTTKLQGIPEEYNNYLYYIEDETADGIKKAIETTLNKSKEELHRFGLEAQKFALDNKNNITQAKRIIHFTRILDKN